MNYQKYTLYLLITLILPISTFAKIQKEYYISNLGSDQNTGTIKLPFATIMKARDVVKSINKQMTGDIIINLRGGTYELPSVFTLNSDDSGTNGYSIIYKAYRSEVPIISGGKSVGPWVLYDSVKNIYKTKVDTIQNSRQLYVNGVRAVRARSKDASGWSEKGDGYDCPEYVKYWKNITNVEVVSFKEWKCHRGHISSVKDNHVTMAQPYWQYIHYVYDAPPVWIENAFELLDTNGEWYLDYKKGGLYYIPRKDENLDKAEVILPKLETLILGNNVSHIQIIGITFSYATWLFPNSDHGFPCTQADLFDPAQIPTEKRQMPGNICFEYSHNVRIENCRFTHLGASGLQFFTGCNNNEIINNKFDDISGSAISIGNLKETKPIERDSVTDNLIENNLITHVAEEYKGCVGILVGIYTTHTTITHNEIRHLPYTGISVGWVFDKTILAGKNNDISYNRIDSIMIELRDGGGIYTLGTQPGSRVHHNFINHQFNTSGSLYPDVGTSDMRWDHNVVMNTKRWIHLWHPRSKNDTIENNYFDTKIQTLEGTNCVYRNNVFISDNILPGEAKTIIKQSGLIKK